MLHLIISTVYRHNKREGCIANSLNMSNDIGGLLVDLSAPNLHPEKPPPPAFPATPFCVNDKRWLKRKSSVLFYTYNVQFIKVKDSKLLYDHSWFAVNILDMKKSISLDTVNNTTHPRRQEPTIRTIKYSAIYPQHGGNAVTCKPSIGSFRFDYGYDYDYEIRHFCAKRTPYADAISY